MNLLACHFDEHRLTDKLLAAAQDHISRLIARVHYGFSQFWTSSPLSPRVKGIVDVLMLVLGLLAFVYFLKLMSEVAPLMPAGR